jgi:signal-transduction protein with cAMP-binding, CBS, and nucleotidyltransferase domain
VLGHSPPIPLQCTGTRARASLRSGVRAPSLRIRVVGGSRDPLTTQVSEVMTSAVRSVGPATSISEAFRLMSDRRHRHLPVIEDGQVSGLISMGDATRWVIRTQQERMDLAIGAVKQMGMSNRRG